MRVLILSQYYDPDPISKPSEVAEGLKRRGHDVTVVTGLPNYPSGTLHAGYHIVPWMRERFRGIPILRVFELPYHGRSAVGRIANYASFMTSGIVGGLFVSRPDVIYVWHPPLTVGAAAAIIGALRRVPFVLDVQDIWPEAVIYSGVLREGFLADVMRKLERFVYGRAQRILIPTDGARRNLLGKGVPPEKLIVLPNWISGEVAVAPSTDSVRRARAELDADDAFVVTFAGNLGVLQDLDTVLEASAQLHRYPTKIAIRIIGDGSERKRLEHVARSRGLENVRFLGPYESKRMPAFLAASDALLVHLNAGDLNRLILPTKVITYMAAARPVIAATGGAAGELIDRSRGGLSTRGGDPATLAAAIIDLAELPDAERKAMGDRAREVALAEFDRERLIDRLGAVLAKAARRA